MSLSFRVVVDNKESLSPKFLKAWGLAIVIEIGEQRILFDTGPDYRTLANNLSLLGYTPHDFDILFLSHKHFDHVGGIHYLGDIDYSGIVVIEEKTHNIVKTALLYSNIHIVGESPYEIRENIYSTGSMKGLVPEHSLIIKQEKQVFIFTGCSHQGVVNIAKRSREIFPKSEIALLIGGFHLLYKSDEEITNIGKTLKEYGVSKVAPIHCSGYNSHKILKDMYNKDFLDIKIGKKYSF